MEKFQLFAVPWWVNVLILIPFATYYGFRKKRPHLGRGELMASFVFGAAFGFVEAAVVVYLRMASGILPPGTAAQVIGGFPQNLFMIEVLREAATLVTLLSLSFLASKTFRGRLAVFLWTFAAWDIFYYIFLWLMIRWPSSLMTTDVLFLIPVPWLAEIWFPLLVDALTISTILLIN